MEEGGFCSEMFLKWSSEREEKLAMPKSLGVLCSCLNLSASLLLLLKALPTRLHSSYRKKTK